MTPVYKPDYLFECKFTTEKTLTSVAVKCGENTTTKNGEDVSNMFWFRIQALPDNQRGKSP